MTIDANHRPVATSRSGRATVLSLAIIVITTIPVAAGPSVASDEPKVGDFTDAAWDSQPTTPAPIPTVESPLEEPSRDDVATASNAGVYEPGTGPTEVTATRSYVSLRRCEIDGFPYEDKPCDEPQSWAYVTGSVDSPGVHYGLLWTADDLVLSALDDRLFLASAASFSQGPPSAPPAWLIDSVTGERGPLTWHDEPTTVDSADQVMVLSPSPHSIPWHLDSGEPFLPRVVDRPDWTVRPLSVPEDATAALAIHQPGSGRIWIGTAPEGGHIGLAYTDDGGASWTDVELPSSLRPTSAELISVVPGGDQLLVVAASGDHVAVTDAWGGATDVVVSADAGETWSTVVLDPADGNGRRLYVLADDRLMVVLSNDFQATGLQFRPRRRIGRNSRIPTIPATWLGSTPLSMSTNMDSS